MADLCLHCHGAGIINTGTAYEGPCHRCTTPEQIAKARHASCQVRWKNLSPQQRKGTTFHGWEAHLVL